MLAPVLALALAGALGTTAPALDFHTEQAQIVARQVGSVILRNPSQVSAFRVEVRFDYPEGLVPVEPIQAEGWECTAFTHFTRCRRDEFPGGATDRISFSFREMRPESGIQPAYATLSARDLGVVRTLVFHVFTSQSWVVTTTDDFGAGSLRDAIESVNASPFCGTAAPCFISFNVIREPQSMTIAPSSPLPPIRKCNVSISGPDDLEFPSPTKLIAISGENSWFGNGLEVRASCAQDVPGVKIRSLAVHSWPWNGIYFEAPAPHAGNARHELWQVYVGTDRTGLIAKPNRSRGINVDSPHEDVLILDSIASGNGRSGIAFWRGKRGSVLSTKMGVDRMGGPMGNGAGGFFSFGVPFEIFNSTIAYNNFSGVAIMPGTPVATIANSRIHSNANLPIDWSIDNRSPDDDESDRIPNAPRVLDAFYDAGSNLTRIRGVVRLTAGAFGGTFRVQILFATTTRGDVDESVPPQAPQPVMAPQSGTADVTFELVVPGDHRGKLVALQTQAGAEFVRHIASEISEALPVR